MVLAATITVAVPVAAASQSPSATAVSQQESFDRLIAQAKTSMLGDPVRARDYGREAGALAASWPGGSARDVAIATAQWIQGEGAYRSSDLAAAAPMIANAIRVAERVAPRGKLHADLLLTRARLNRENGHPQDALADFQQAYQLFSILRDERSKAKALQSIGSIYQDAKDYDRVLYYYRSAEDLYSSDPTLALPAYNNIADAYFHLGRFKEAAIAYDRSFRLAQHIKSPLLAARILDNIADLAIENNNYTAAYDAVSAGLSLAARPAAASWRPLLYGTLAKLEFRQGKLISAVRHLQLAFSTGQHSDTDRSFGGVHLTAYRVFKASGETAQALEHLEAFRRMDEEGRTLAASTNAALMTARFDFANQNARIATLKAGQLSRDVALTRLRARQSTVIFSGLLALLLTMLVFLFVYLRSVRRNRNEVMRANDRLARTNTELEQALAAKSQFLATTSHEIRTPLNGILGMTQVVLADEAVGGVVRERIGLVEAAGRAMRTLVDDILDFAKMDSQAVRLETAAVDLTTVLPELASLWRIQAQAKGINFLLSIEDLEQPMLTDVARLRQILSNLLSNALKFTASGAVKLVAWPERIESEPMVVIEVVDTGIGIPTSAFESIFEPFRQLDSSTTRRFGGTGLGLAISRNLARFLGGDITVRSTPGSGATFRLQLPYHTAAAMPEQPRPGMGWNVLVVSDSPIRRSYLRTALESELGRTTVCSLEELGATLQAFEIGVVLIDWAGDGGSAGVTALQAVFDKLPMLPPVVLLSPEDSAGCEHLAGVRIAVKPLRKEQLTAILKEELGRSPVISQRSVPEAVVFDANLA